MLEQDEVLQNLREAQFAMDLMSSLNDGPRQINSAEEMLRLVS